MDLDSVLKLLQRKKVELDISKKKLFENKLKLIKEQQFLFKLNQLKLFLMEVATKCQKQTLEYIETIVTYCIQIYGEEWRFKIEVKDLHNQQEFHFYFLEGDIQHSIKDDIVAGGILDMTNLGLRIAMHSLDPEAEPILLLDEPFKSLGDKTPEAGALLKEIAKERNLQIVIITHSEFLTNIGNRIFKI